MSTIPILSFHRLLKPTVWGGRRLHDQLHIPLPDQATYGESWEICDLEGEQSIVSEGALQGVSLEHLCREYLGALMGKTKLLYGRFPLLLKFIDARDTLSVQVHPDKSACAKLKNGARPKTEAWYIIDAEPGAVLYIGFRDGVDPSVLADGIASGEVASLLNKVPVRPGDRVLLPSGTVHAIGAGILLAEVQQSSNTTYRVFDWNRLGLDGLPRPLHIPESLASIAFDHRNEPASIGRDFSTGRIACDHFTMEPVILGREETREFGVEDAPLMLMHVRGDGEVTVQAGSDPCLLRLGETKLVPAALSGKIVLHSRGAAEILLIHP